MSPVRQRKRRPQQALGGVSIDGRPAPTRAGALSPAARAGAGKAHGNVSIRRLDAAQVKAENLLGQFAQLGRIDP